MEPEGSLPCSQELTASPWPEPDESISVTAFLFISDAFRLMWVYVFQTVSFFQASQRKHARLALLPMHATCPANFIRPRYIAVLICGEEQLQTVCLIMLLSPVFYFFVLGSTILPQRLALCSRHFRLSFGLCSYFLYSYHRYACNVSVKLLPSVHLPNGRWMSIERWWCDSCGGTNEIFRQNLVMSSRCVF